MRSGKTVWYYQCYDENGVRVCGHSTGQATKTAAREHCILLFRENKLLMKKAGRVPTFGEFAKGFWDYDTGEYVNYLKTRRPMSKQYTDHSKSMADSYLLEKFKNIPLDKITESMVDGWLVSLLATPVWRKSKNKKAGGEVKTLSPSSANTIYRVLRTMLNWAVKKHVLKFNPCSAVKELKQKDKDREILSPAEVRKLFGGLVAWDDSTACLMCKLAACTGMRIGEIIGLKGKFVFEGHIVIAGQYHDVYGYTDTKSHKPRTITTPALIGAELKALKAANGDEGFVFSKDMGKSAITRKALYASFNGALNALGLADEEIKRRGLTFHSWRHFFNTTLRLANVADSKVRSVIGHANRRETEHYTHFDTKEFAEIKQVQEKLLAGV
jgi:integrase